MSPGLSAGDPRAPKFWMYETSGVLRPAIEAYLHNRPMTVGQIALMRVYLRQWIMSPVWQGGEALEQLRSAVEELRSQRDIREWIKAALDEGHDPL